MTASDPARIFPQEIASSGRAPESEPSNSWPVFCISCEREQIHYERWTHNVDRKVGSVSLKISQQRPGLEASLRSLTMSMAFAI